MNFEGLVVKIVSQIPSGKVMTYLQIAELTGNPRRARHISGVLRRHEDLPWHRVISSKGTISLPRGQGYELQRALLADEGVLLNPKQKIDLEKYLFRVDV